MRVILKTDVNKLGAAGTLADVSDGYARNFLFPRGLAEEATPGRLAAWKEEQARKKARDDKKRQEAEEACKQLRGRAVRISARAGENGKLFGSVTATQIADALSEQFSIEADKREIKIDAAVRQPGSYPFSLGLYPGVRAEMTLVVSASDE